MDASSSPEAIGAVDDLLTSVGLQPRRRRTRGKTVGQARASTAEPTARPAASDMRVSRAGALEWLTTPPWQTIPWLVHGMSTRRGGFTTAYLRERTPSAPPEQGELNLGFAPADTRENVERNRDLFVRSLWGEPADAPPKLVTVRQIHSAVTYVADRSQAQAPVPFQGDGLMTTEPGLLLGIQTADCIPVLVVDCRIRAVAAFHAGWRGTLKRIVQGGVGRMRMEFGSRPEDLEAAIGPGIGPCCYAVGEEVRSEFESQFAYAPELFSEVYDSDPVREKYPLLFMTARAPGHSPIGPSLHLDLIEANRRQLLDAGLRPQAIHVAHRCTACEPDLFFSYRAECGFCGRMMSVIGVRHGPAAP